MRRLPPLAAYRAFEAVARHVSFVEAARELNVTRSAVSHQVRALEEFLGVSLFRRLATGIQLTADAERLLPEATEALNMIAESTKLVTEKRPSVYLHCSTSFALQWAARHIGRFENAHPNILVRLSTASGADKTNVEHVDLEVLYYELGAKAARKELLLPELLLPVCSPEFLNGERFSAAELLQKRLLKNSPSGWDWMQWCKSVSLPTEMANDALEIATSFDVDSAAIQAACNGMGIALANLCYVKPELDSGVLVPATDVKPFELGYHKLAARVELKSYQKKFVDWLEDCARETIADVQDWHALSLSSRA